MSFDTNKFLARQYKDRTVEVPVPELVEYFGEEETAVWVVKALTASEIAVANDEVVRNMDLTAIVTALASSISSDKGQAVKELVGVSTEKVPGEIAKRISQLVSGSVEPVIDRDIAIKLATNHSVTFYKLTNKILELSGKGRLGE